MKGIVTEGEEIMDLGLDKDAKDAGLIAAAQKAEHYEIALYGTSAHSPSNSATARRHRSCTRRWKKKSHRMKS